MLLKEGQVRTARNATIQYRFKLTCWFEDTSYPGWRGKKAVLPRKMLPSYRFAVLLLASTLLVFKSSTTSPRQDIFKPHRHNYIHRCNRYSDWRFHSAHYLQLCQNHSRCACACAALRASRTLAHPSYTSHATDAAARRKGRRPRRSGRSARDASKGTPKQQLAGGKRFCKFTTTFNVPQHVYLLHILHHYIHTYYIYATYIHLNALSKCDFPRYFETSLGISEGLNKRWAQIYLYRCPLTTNRRRTVLYLYMCPHTTMCISRLLVISIGFNIYRYISMRLLLVSCGHKTLLSTSLRLLSSFMQASPEGAY